MARCLDGHRILDLTDERGFLCGRMLADLGADVVKVEPPGGDAVRGRGPFAGRTPDPERSIPWLAYNAGKRGITLDVTRPRGREILDRLCASADALVESYDPDALRDARLDYASVAARHPHLVLCSISPFGRSGPHAGYRGSDLTVTAMGGNMALTGDPDRAPLRCTMPSSYFHGGAEAATGLLIALYARDAVGRGQHVDVSLQAAMVSTIMTGASQWWQHRRDRGRSGALYVVGNTLQREVWRCRDGFVSYALRGGPARIPGLVATAKWMAEEGIDAPAWNRDWSAYNHNNLTQAEVDELSRPLQVLFDRKTMRELFAGAIERGLMLAPVNDAREIAASEQLAARSFFAEIRDEGRGLSYSLPARFARASDVEMDVRGPAPRLGEHNAAVYGEIGIRDAELADLRREGVV
ncbi:MAG TPA: CoA transferase [Candidatus Binatia bacterium]|nr:CoA transferase [Candidatus Binatia bacterium]